MKKLGQRNYELLAACGGSTYVERFYEAQEGLYIGEASIIYDFCLWCDENDKPFGSGNYEDRFQEFLATKEDSRYVNEQELLDMLNDREGYEEEA